MSELSRPRLARVAEVALLPCDEGPLRHVLRHPEVPGSCLRLGDAEAGLALALDGTRDLDELMGATRRAIGTDGPALMVRLLAELGDRGLLEGMAPQQPSDHVPLGLLARLARPRTWSFRRAPAAIDRLHRRGGRLLLTLPALVVIVAVASAGLAATVALVAQGGAQPLTVGGRLGLGALCFLAARALLVAAHEIAHGLALAETGHRVGAAGVRLLAVFPYAFVDTSPVWLEPRKRRMAVTAAGPLSDLTIAGAAAIAALATGGELRDVCFQVCLAGYLAALLNLNPCLPRDGYHLLCEALRRPDLRESAVADLQRRLAGRRGPEGPRVLIAYGVSVVVWGVVGASLATAMAAHALPALRAALPSGVSLPILLVVWTLLLAPTAMLVGRPLWLRRVGARSS
ncbi:MAG TPA: hypothetical protein VHX88_05805 [Solirubrobacteraceae bacterium]|jgi:putative peptide zinc metalloprotease protein|nr:hypothetical protein [Solirubrobacteraceae bacterium]